MSDPLRSLALEIAACRICRDAPVGEKLPHQPRPVVVLSNSARIRIIGQAPGKRVHLSGKPFTDPSGDRLRDWMGINEEQFYNPEILAITPMGFCFPGYDGKGGDLPPRIECARHWHPVIEGTMPQVELVLLIGQYAQKHYLGARCGKTLTETVANWREIAQDISEPLCLPLPHPSWRNNGWIKKNPWFSSDLLPFMRRKIQTLLLKQ